MDFANSIAQQSPEDAGKAVASEPDAMSQRVLGRLIPKRSNQTEAWTYDTFEHSEEYSEDHKGCKICGRSMACKDDRPAKNGRSKVLSNWELDESNRSWDTGNKVAEVESTAGPRVLLADKML